MSTTISVTCDVCGAMASMTIRFAAVNVRSAGFQEHLDLCMEHWKPWRDFMNANHPKYVAAAGAEVKALSRALATSEKQP